VVIKLCTYLYIHYAEEEGSLCIRKERNGGCRRGARPPALGWYSFSIWNTINLISFLEKKNVCTPSVDLINVGYD
jgi:hypothetical protein